MAPTASSRPDAVHDRRAVGLRQAGEHRRVEVDGAAAAQHVQQLHAVGRVARFAARRVEAIARRHEQRQRRRGVAQDDEQRALPRVSQVERRLEQAAGERRRSPTARSHISYFAWTSSRCQRAFRKLKISTPCANTLISCEGLSTRQMLRLLLGRQSRAAR